MTLRRLAAAFENRTELPIELSEIRDVVVGLGIQDNIVFSDEDMDPANCRGAFYQYTTRGSLYGDPQLNTLIVYSSHLPLPWQRMVCCKELVHVFDRQESRTRTEEEVVGLAEKLLGPLSSEDYGRSDFMAAHDKIALYQGLAIIFPPAALTIAQQKLASGKKTVDEIADWCCLPRELVSVTLDADWMNLRDTLMNC